MPGATAEPLSIPAFRKWVESRPEKERWELIAGVPVMMAPPSHDHQRIASNLELLLNEALSIHRPELRAYLGVGLNVAPVAPDYDPEPDVAVISAAELGAIHYSDRFYLAAEIVSKSDRATVERKRDIYKRHPDCRCVLLIQQDRFDVDAAVLSEAGWTDHRLTRAEDYLIVDEFGLRCTLWELYRGTLLQPRWR